MNGKYITMEELRRAFDRAEQETADHFNQQTCALDNKDGVPECPICFFRIQVRKHLGMEWQHTYAEHGD